MGIVTTQQVASIHSAAIGGFTCTPITVETDSSAGLPLLQIVGMGSKAVNEARQRVRSAIRHSSLEFPARKITINLAPADIPKDGTHFDLPIAVGILVASGQLTTRETSDALFAGELSLSGGLRPIRGTVLIAEAAKQLHLSTVYVPADNVTQARLVEGVRVIGIESLTELYLILKGVRSKIDTEEIAPSSPNTQKGVSLDAVAGQQQAKRALIIAAAGRHNLLLSGSPGAGKTMLAKALPPLLPHLSPEEVLEVTKIHSLSSRVDNHTHLLAPFREPHHTATLSALIGGGARNQPGEISLAHKGVLLLDEITEFPRASLEALRQPLEDRVVHLSRLYEKVTYPANPILVATTNPCRCGYYGDEVIPCTCSPVSLRAHQEKLSGPFIDRIDLFCTIRKTSQEHIFDTQTMIKKQHFPEIKTIQYALNMQMRRYKRSDYYNAYASLAEVKNLFQIHPDAQKLLSKAMQHLGVGTRSMLKTIRVARTIADLEGSESIESQHVAEALQFRSL